MKLGKIRISRVGMSFRTGAARGPMVAVRVFVLAALCATLLGRAPLAFADGRTTFGLGTLSAIGLSPDGRQLAVATSIGVYFFDAESFAPIGFWSVDGLAGIREWASPIQWSPDGSVLIIPGSYEAQFFSVPDGLRLWKHATCWRCTWSFSQDSTRAVLVRDAHSVEVYAARDGNLIEKLAKPDFWKMAEWRVANLAVDSTQSADGKLAFVGVDWEHCWLCAFVYAVPERKLASTASMEYLAMPGTVSPNRAALSPDGRWVATSDLDGTVSLWQVGQSEQPLYTVPVHHAGHYYENTFAWSPDSHTLYSAARNMVVALDVASGAQLRRLDGFSAEAVQVAWSIDGRWVYSAQGEQLAVTEVATGRPTVAASLLDILTVSWAGAVSDLLPDPTGQRLAVVGVGVVAVVEPSTLRPLYRLFPGSYGGVAAFSPDGAQLATAGAGTLVTVWDAASGKSHFGSWPAVHRGPPSASCSLSRRRRNRILAAPSRKPRVAAI
jgi:WD40 repeat protein